MHTSRSHGAVIRVYDDAGNVIGTYEHSGDLNGSIIRSGWLQSQPKRKILWSARLISAAALVLDEVLDAVLEQAAALMAVGQ